MIKNLPPIEKISKLGYFDLLNDFQNVKTE